MASKRGWGGGKRARRDNSNGWQKRLAGLDTEQKDAGGKIPRLSPKHWQAIELAAGRHDMTITPGDGFTARSLAALLENTPDRPAMMKLEGDTYTLLDDGLQAWNRKQLHKAKTNQLNDSFERIWLESGDSRYPFVREVKDQIPGVGYIFDFANIGLKVAIEIQGGIYGDKGGHTTIGGYERDCDKQNRAAAAGWRLLAFTSGMLRDKETCIQLIIQTCEIAEMERLRRR